MILSKLFQAELNKKIAELIPDSGTLISISKLHGGSINETYQLSFQNLSIVIKLNQSQKSSSFFEREYQGLQLLKNTESVNIPMVFPPTTIQEFHVLIMEYINEGTINTTAAEKLGYDLAKLHQNYDQNFGLEHDNYIGTLVQKNGWYDAFIPFFIECRLEYQLKLAIDLERLPLSSINHFNQLFRQLEKMIPQESPSLIHGDLWSGNYIVSKSSISYLIDPAVYYGHREIDIAMMHLFGGFSSQVFDSYQREFPLCEDWENRVDLFNIYPLLVHVNLFGKSYVSRLNSVLRKYI